LKPILPVAWIISTDKLSIPAALNLGAILIYLSIIVIDTFFIIDT
jgi:hypothetical protein